MSYRPLTPGSNPGPVFPWHWFELGVWIGILLVLLKLKYGG